MENENITTTMNYIDYNSLNMTNMSTLDGYYQYLDYNISRPNDNFILSLNNFTNKKIANVGALVYVTYENLEKEAYYSNANDFPAYLNLPNRNTISNIDLKIFVGANTSTGLKLQVEPSVITLDNLERFALGLNQKIENKILNYNPETRYASNQSISKIIGGLK